jgi:large subunit ribosomal protein L35
MFHGGSGIKGFLFPAMMPPTCQPMLSPMQVSMQTIRTRILYSRRGGNPKTVKPVIRRFFRLYNGLWIRTRAGRNKKKWTKTPARIHRLKQHVVCTRSQCQLLDKMVNRYFRLPKYYADDPYAPYHRKSNLPDYRYQPPKFLP